MFTTQQLVVAAFAVCAVLAARGSRAEETKAEQAEAGQKCSGACAPIPKHYEELGCKPHTAEGACCPERYECPDVNSYTDDKCMFRGRAYKAGESIAEADIAADCSAACRCSDFSGKPRFECALVECPNLFQGLQPGCVEQRSLTACCAASSVCGADADALPECHHEGKHYRQGDAIYPQDAPCHQCICDAGWDNRTAVADNKNCRRIDCGIELRSLHRVRGGCVPVYFGEQSCCPIGWRCPEKTDEVVPLDAGRSDESVDAQMQCTYNGMQLQRGQRLNSVDACVECACRSPPMVDCVRKPNC